MKLEELKVGQRVKGKVESGGGVFEGIVYYIKGTQATIKRDDGKHGGGVEISEPPYLGQQGWDINYNITKNKWGSDCDDGELFLVEEPKIVKKKKETIAKEADKKNINIEIYRKDGKTFFKFEIHPNIEKLYADLSVEQKKSVKWEGLEFYSVPDLTTNQNYKEKLNRYRLFDDFGQDILEGGKLNIAWVRTIGGKGEIQIKNPVSFSELSLLFRNAVQFIKEHFEESFKDFRIKGTLQVDI